MRINQNALAINSYRNLSSTNTSLGKSLEKLSSGFRINRAADDAAGLVISQNLRAQISGLKQATRNAQDGISVVQTAEGALTEVNSMLERMRTLAVQAGNTGANNEVARKALQQEIDELVDEVDRIGKSTNFGGVKLLSGDFATSGATFQIGAGSVQATEQLSITIQGVAASAVGSSGVDLTAITTGGASGVAASTLISASNNTDAAANALSYIDTIDKAISAVSALRGKLGASQNRFESVINSLNVSVENLTASESRIRDTDMAQEMTTFTRNQILSQAGTAMLAQANQVPQTVLQLLG